MAEKFIAMRMQIPPLMPNGIATGKGIEVALKIARRDLMRRLKRKLGQTGFSLRAKAAFQKALRIEYKPASLVVTVKHPAFEALVYGRRKKQMRWLKKATRPIPIITETGKLIFRSAHARSLTWKNGPMTGPNVGKKKGWVHPGRPPEDFVEQAKTEARVFLKDKLKRELANEVRKAFVKRRR
jgi:hypothetical protein